MSARTPYLRKLSGLVPVLAFLLLVVSVTPAQAQVAEARRALNDGRYAEAIAQLTAGLEQRPDNAEMLVLRGQAFEARGQLEEAARDYEHALRVNPDDAVAQSGLQRARRGAETATSATAEAFRRHVEANPNNLSFRLQYADALRNAGRLADAAEQYRIYFSRTQGSPDIVTTYLVVIAGLGQHDTGVAEATRFLNLYPSSSDLWMRLGYFRLWQGEYASAEEAFQRALTLNPGNAEARTGLARSQVRVAEGEPAAAPPAAAVIRLEQQLARNPNQPDVRFRLVDELVRLRRNVEAFGQLQILHADFGQTERWHERFRRVDRALPENAPVYKIDRLAYRVELSPSNMQARYALVDALLEGQRYREAYTALLAGSQHAGGDPAFHQRLANVRQQRLANVRQQRDALVAQLNANPSDIDAARRLASYYPLLQESGDPNLDVNEAIGLYERLLAMRPDDHEIRLHYARFLTYERRTADAVAHSRRLLQVNPDDPAYITQYLYAAVQQVPPPADAERIAQRGVEIAPNDPAVLLAVATFYTSGTFDGFDHLDQAERFIQRAANAGADAQEVLERLAAVQHARRYLPLADAREAAGRGRYQDAINIIESYYRVTGTPIPRQATIELAHHYAAAGDVATGMRLLEEAQREQFTEDVQMALARLQFDNREYGATLATLDQVLARQPRHGDARILYGDALREMRRFDEAEASYRQALADGDQGARIQADDRLVFLNQINGRSPQVGFGVLLAPRTDFIGAGGDGISYNRISPGLDAQLTLPGELPLVLTAGYQAHYVSGTDLIVPQFARDVPSYMADELRAGAIVEITPGGPQDITNRLHAEAGVFLYHEFINALTREPDSRSAPHWSVTFTHRRPGLLELSARARQTEGAIELWAPIGPSINLTLLQADVQVKATPLDELLKVQGRIAYNRVIHDRALFSFGQFAGFTGEKVINNGFNVDLKVGYRLTGPLYGGLIYNRLQYGHSSPFYFAPSDRPYELYEAFLEYETGDSLGGPYFRALGAVGTVAFSGGFLTRRLEADLIYPLVANLSAGVNLRASQSGRSFADGSFSSYNILVFTGALYIGL